MDLSGIIFVVLAVAWAAYLVPKALKHHDEVARTRSVERFSTAMRVLARREPVDRRNARLVVTPPRPTGRVVTPSRSAATATATATAPAAAARPASPAARRAAARAAARRRRRVLLGLLVVDAVVVALAAFAIVPWWSVAIPLTLTALYLVLCRTQVRRENSTLWESRDVVAPESSEEVAVPRRAIRIEAPYGTVRVPQSSTVEPEFSPDEDTIAIPMAELQTVAVAVETADGGSLWDPLPVTLPTYVTKARAARTVRTIDLSAPGTWTSGRDEADTALVAQAATAEASAQAAETEQQRVVGG